MAENKEFPTIFGGSLPCDIVTIQISVQLFVGHKAKSVYDPTQTGHYFE
jgi:hypothetical protein